MLQKQDLVDNFSELMDLGPGLVRCQVETPRSTHYYYTRFAPSGSKKCDFLVVSENRLDDDFARLVLDCVPDLNPTTGLTALPLPLNKYGFSRVLLAPQNYHSYFKGILDNKRDNLALCLPVHRCEFYGDEPASEFILMRRELINYLDWERNACPKAILRFDNPKTRSGTGNREVLAKYELILREIDNINGVTQGFIEISNYQKRTIEVLSPEIGVYVFIRDRNDNEREVIDKSILLEKLWLFLTEA